MKNSARHLFRRHSRKRAAILELFRSSETHPGALSIYEQLKPELQDLSLGTVYRNIKILIEEGELASIGVINGEERFDGEPEPHSHTVCTRCGTIRDLPEKTETELSAHFPKEIPGFIIEIRNTMFYGLCIRCKSDGCVETTALGR